MLVIRGVNPLQYIVLGQRWNLLSDAREPTVTTVSGSRVPSIAHIKIFGGIIVLETIEVGFPPYRAIVVYVTRRCIE